MRTRLWICSCLGSLALCMLLGLANAQSSPPSRQSLEKLVDIGPTGIDIKRPLFAGACKACPWGILAFVTQAALKPYGYDVKICWVCWSSFGPRQMADKTKPTLPPGAEENPLVEYIEPPPNAVPDISATSEINLINAWNGEGAYAADHKKRQNYRIIAVVQQPNFLMVAANKKSDITDLSQVNTRTQPTWIAFTTRDTPVDHILAHYGITEEGLKAKGGWVYSKSRSATTGRRRRIHRRSRLGQHTRAADVVRDQSAKRSGILRYPGAVADEIGGGARLSAGNSAYRIPAWSGASHSHGDALSSCYLCP